MKKAKYIKSFTLIFISIFIVSFVNKKPINDLIKANLKGNVKFVLTTYYNTKDSNGVKIKTTIFAKSRNEYNYKGNLVQVIVYWAGTDYIQQRDTFTYNKQGDLCFNIFHNSKAGKLMDSCMFDSCIYNSHNILTKKKYLSTTQDSTFYGYYDIYKYDTRCKLTELDKYQWNKQVEICKYDYDSRDNIIEEKDSDIWGITNFKTLFKYDNNHNMIESDFQGKVGGSPKYSNIVFYKPEIFDKEGNWIKELYVITDSITRIIERKIEYYESNSTESENLIPDLFNNRTEAKNQYKNGKKEGKWIEFMDSNYNYISDNNAPYYVLLTYHNDSQIGGLRIFYKDGKIRAETNYSDMECASYGVEKYYYESGALECENPFFNRKENGTEIDYYENGKMKKEIPFKNDTLNGIERDYYEDGKLKEEIPWINGVVNGWDKEYHENGNLQRETLYTDGNITKIKNFDLK